MLSQADYKSYTARKVSNYGIFSGPYFPTFGQKTEIYEVNLCIQSECGKIQTIKPPYLDTFHAVIISENVKEVCTKRLFSLV